MLLHLGISVIYFEHLVVTLHFNNSDLSTPPEHGTWPGTAAYTLVLSRCHSDIRM